MAAVKHIRSRAKTPRTASRPAFSSPLDKASAHEVVWPQVSDLFNAARTISNPSFVYLVGEEDGPIKIGLAKDPISRIRSMQTGNPRRLKIEYAVLGDRPVERMMHDFWRPFAIPSARTRDKPDAAPGTEWFRTEARDELCAVVATAVASQVEHLNGPHPGGMVSTDDLLEIVWAAHREHDIVLHRREPPRLLAASGGRH